MSETDKAARRARQQRRLGAALRDNLKRRKAQVRGRKEGRQVPETTADGGERPHDSAGIAVDKVRAWDRE